MNVNLALCLNAPLSMAADGQGAQLHLEAMQLCHLPGATSSWVQEKDLLSLERSAGVGCSGELSSRFAKMPGELVRLAYMQVEKL